MAIQELYNKLRIKREYGREDVVTRLSFEEVDILLEGLRELGADTNTGYENLLAFKEGLKSEKKNVLHKDETIPSYEGLRARAKTGKYKDAVGYIHLVKNGKKPIRMVFPSGKEQVYHLEQIEVIDKDNEKLNDRIRALVFKKEETE